MQDVQGRIVIDPTRAREFVDELRLLWPNIRQLQDGFTNDPAWSEWDESVRQQCIAFGLRWLTDGMPEGSITTESNDRKVLRRLLASVRGFMDLACRMNDDDPVAPAMRDAYDAASAYLPIVNEALAQAEPSEPAWYAIETPGADCDVTFVTTRGEAIEYLEHPDDFDEKVVPLYTHPQSVKDEPIAWALCYDEDDGRRVVLELSDREGDWKPHSGQYIVALGPIGKAAEHTGESDAEWSTEARRLLREATLPQTLPSRDLLNQEIRRHLETR